jgi:hypothetical protein
MGTDYRGQDIAVAEHQPDASKVIVNPLVMRRKAAPEGVRRVPPYIVKIWRRLLNSLPEITFVHALSTFIFPLRTKESAPADKTLTRPAPIARLSIESVGNSKKNAQLHFCQSDPDNRIIIFLKIKFVFFYSFIYLC